MPDKDQMHSITIIVVAALLSIIVVAAIFFWPSGFSVVAKNGDSSVELKFSDKVNLNEILDTFLSKAGDKGADPALSQRLVVSVLASHGFYRIPSEQAIDALRHVNESDNTRQFARGVRSMLFDLAGPFSRPATFLDAPDDRILLAIGDLRAQKPSSPVFARLWEDSLNLRGIFEPRAIGVSVKEDRALKNNVAATCAGSMLLGRGAQISNGDRFIKVRFGETKACSPASLEDMLDGKAAVVWVSTAEMDELTQGGAAAERQTEFHAQLVPFPAHMTTFADTD